MYFEKTENKRMKQGIELVQIRYLKDLPQFDVKAGQLGGWVSERAFLAQNGKWFLGENAEVDGGVILGGVILGGVILGGRIYGGEIRGGVIHGGVIHGGRIDGDLPKDFGKVPYIEGGRYPVNFAGYSKEGERKFACGCQVYEESMWTPEFMKTLARKHNFIEQERILAEELFEVVKKMTPKKTIQIPEKVSNEQTLEKISENVASMKIQVTEPLKTETISLTESLKVEPKETFEQSFNKLSQDEKVNLLKSLIAKM